MTRVALAVRHVHFEHLGSFAGVLERRNYTVRYVEAGRDDLARIDPLQPDLLVILGGPIGAYEEHRYPFVLDELHLLERRLAADRLTLGICLGAQLMARALGARVYRGPEKEIGWAPIRLSDAGQHSPLRHLGSGQTAVLHWHGDTFDLPAGSVRLASTPAYENQAFAWRQNGLGLQFHAEIRADEIEHWLIGHACELGTVAGLSLDALRADAGRLGGALARHGPAFFDDWIDDMAQFVPGDRRERST